MVELTVTNARVPDPSTRGRMLSRGFKLFLSPEQYPAHERLVERLVKTGGWRVSVDVGPPGPIQFYEYEDRVEKMDAESTHSVGGLLPHQLSAVDKIRAGLPAVDLIETADD